MFRLFVFDPGALQGHMGADQSMPVLQITLESNFDWKLVEKLPLPLRFPTPSFTRNAAGLDVVHLSLTGRRKARTLVEFMAKPLAAVMNGSSDPFLIVYIRNITRKSALACLVCCCLCLQ